jgi:hypothetical protein
MFERSSAESRYGERHLTGIEGLMVRSSQRAEREPQKISAWK